MDVDYKKKKIINERRVKMGEGCKGKKVIYRKRVKLEEEEKRPRC